MVEIPPAPAFDDPGRVCADELDEQRRHLADHCGLILVDTVPSMMLVLNAQRQIVHANRVLLEFVGLDELGGAIGLRPGELFGCVHSAENPGGCGSSSACAQCGALLAIRDAASGGIVDRQGQVLVSRGGRLEAQTVKVRAVVVDFGGIPFFLVYIQDDRDRRAREVMESLFLHDALNALNGISGMAGLLRDEVGEDQRELVVMILERSGFLVSEIRAYRMLQDAEQAGLEPRPELVDPDTLCTSLIRGFEAQAEAADVRLVYSPPDGAPFQINTDKRILCRVLENLLKNAIEASAPGATVRIGLGRAGDRVEFSVANEAVIPVHIRHQVFQRFFSTKGSGRGLGTYGAKLFTENALRGNLGFVSEQGRGTVFRVSLPLDLAAALHAANA